MGLYIKVNKSVHNFNNGNFTLCYGTGKTAVMVDVIVDVMVDAEVA